MKKYLLLILILFVGFKTIAQKQKITLEDIWKQETFRPQYMSGLHSMKKGDYYIVINNRGQHLDKYSYKTLEKVETLVNASNLSGINSLNEYTFNEDENKIIIGTDSEQIFRHSFKGIFYVFDLVTKELSILSEDKIQEPTFSPDGNKVAFVKGNNLFYKNLTNNTTKQITFDGEKNKIINGITDWVYEEEFAFVRAFEWNKNSDVIAYLRFDEIAVPEFSMDVFGSDLYPNQQVFKYPKAGEENAKVSLKIYYIETNDPAEIHLENYEYIPRIKWTNEKNTLCVTTINRHQDNLKLSFINVKKNLKPTVILNETDDAYVSVNDNLTFLNDNSFIWTSEKDGYNHIYHYSKKGKLINQITKGKWEVTDYYGYDINTNNIYFQSTQDGSINRTVSSIELDGKNMHKLSSKTGSNTADFSTSFNYYINTYSNAETPTIYTLNKAKSGKEIKIIKENAAIKKEFDRYDLGKKQFSTIKTKDGTFNMWMMKPPHFDKNKEYPLFMYQYSGPGSQQVENRWNYSNDYWHYMLSQKGYIVVCVDGRGTGYKGRDFKKATQKELGKYEIEDQINAAKKLGELPYIDKNRIGIWGWSYGGYMSSLAITKGADTFKMAIAVAPVTSWRFYDSIYTERYMQTPQENASGYDDNSPINFTHLLKGKYLLVHGTGDDNVHVQNTMRMINALVKDNKQFDLLMYPDRTHSIYSTRNDRLYLYKKMTDFILENL